MINYKKIQPEVIVGLGENTVFTEQSSPFKIVTKLHIHLEDWLGDDLMECYACYIVTKKLKSLLSDSNYRGFEILELELTKDEYFESNYNQAKPLPKFYWLNITGKNGIDDMYLDAKKSLNFNEQLLNFIQSHADLRYLDVEPEQNDFDDLLNQMIAESKSQNKSKPDEADDTRDNKGSWLPPDWNKS